MSEESSEKQPKPLFQIKVKDITRTNLTCPCQWELNCVEGKSVKMTFRTGKLKIYLEEKLVLQDSKDDLDVGAYLSDEELIEILKRNNIISEE